MLKILVTWILGTASNEFKKVSSSTPPFAADALKNKHNIRILKLENKPKNQNAPAIRK